VNPQTATPKADGSRQARRTRSRRAIQGCEHRRLTARAKGRADSGLQLGEFTDCLPALIPYPR
jgi:hypothetical protein